MSAADSAQRSDVPQQATNVLKPATLVLNAAANGSAPSANMDDAGESEAKKLRVDEDKTSTYDLSEDEDIDCDETPYAPSISNQEQEQTDKRSYSATLKRPGRQGPSTERHDQSTGNAAHCAQTSHESGRAAQQQPVPLYQQPHLTPYQRRQHSPQRHQSSQRPPQAALRQPATTAPGASASTSDYAPVPMAHVLLPMLFTALRAILSAIPQANNLPEVKALLSMESLVIPQPPSESRQVYNE
ncbi:hypothetical protein HPB50_010002 [Hyalomma asiaticum]|uniref:Uncharacterized protein n=1 Tax=Hyalomma asiaticum TaxID=266040 RepID=A0ACB7SUU0_HYAAI|nr:hypothetical protein HPB50_010002 [Hyalomma asiaticum]